STSTSSALATSFRDIVGPTTGYGIIGIHRGGQNTHGKFSHPVKVSHSVYSFFLLNVKDTVSKGLFFPARPIWEDIEFNNLLDEHGLVVCKMQLYTHFKPIRVTPTNQVTAAEVRQQLHSILSAQYNMCIADTQHFW